MQPSVDQRTTFIGGSSLNDLLAEGKWACRKRLAYRFLGIEPSDKQVETLAMTLGKLLEPKILKYAEEFLGVPIRTNVFLSHAEFPFIGGHPDGIVDPDCIIEIKTTSDFGYYRTSTCGIRQEYLDQVTLYQGLGGKPLGLFFVANQDDPGCAPIISETTFDPQRFEFLISLCLNFVDELTPETLPARCGALGKGLKRICINCEYRTTCQPKCLGALPSF